MVAATSTMLASCGEPLASSATQMFIERSRNYFARSIAVERRIASWVASGFRSHPARTLDRSNDLDALRARLEQASRRVAESERLVAGWREVIERELEAGRDVSVARDLLQTFEIGLEVAMSNKEEAQKAVAQRLLDLFEGARGRLPRNDQELHEWLASAKGKAATAFEATSLSRWGEIGRS
jgi:hypothetical protein